MKLLQINTNRSIPAHDMALATAKDIGAGIILLSEPNKKIIKNRKDWIYDDDIDAAIKVTDGNIVVKRQGQGPSFAYIATNMFTIYSCYASGNKEEDELEEMLTEISRQIRLHKEEAFVVGDFNAKSPQWGMRVTDKRGQIITEWIAENDLVIVNKGKKPTFQRREYSSILDLTLATHGINSKIVKWEVSDRESLSDHNYIIYEVLEEKTLSGQKQQMSEGWQVKKLNRQNLQQELVDIDVEESMISAEGFSRTLSKICKNTMPKRTSKRGWQPVYWWTEEISSLRRECIRNRRMYTRNVKKNQAEHSQRLWEAYKECKKILRDSIRKSKRDKWKEICDNIDCDIWGNGYKIVMKRMNGYPPRPQMTMDMMEEVVKHLFPVHEQVKFNCDKTVIFTNFTVEELHQACKRIKNNKAPGPGNIPAEILKEVALNRPEYVLAVYNKLASRAEFPAEWKRAKLLLLRKGDKPLDNPASYRPISLLDIEGKVYEQLIRSRLNMELVRTGGLAENQYGFREGRQTIDAINAVIRIARKAAAYSHQSRRLCAMITLDVQNAFNSASRQIILEELRKRGVEESLLNVIMAYLSGREIILEAEGIKKTMQIKSGVPQGSVLGPILWNVLYNELLEMQLPEGVAMIGFADDVAMVVTAINEQFLMTAANTGLQLVTNWMERKQLKLAPEKTEAVLLTTKRKLSRIHFNIQSTVVVPSKAVKYLGVWLDSKLTYAEHINKTIQKAEKTLTALARLMPNIGGPRAAKRRILASVAHSQILYAAPTWYPATKLKYVQQRLKRAQRGILIRIISAYRTISSDAAGVIAGVPPIDLMAEERAKKYDGVHKSEAKKNLMMKWQQRWDDSLNGRWTHTLIPDINKWINRRHGEVDYFMTQALSGHGCFREYLHRRKRTDADTCKYCEEVDTVQHTLFECEKWAGRRMQYDRENGMKFTADNMMRLILHSEDSWSNTYELIREIIQQKEGDMRTTN